MASAATQTGEPDVTIDPEVFLPEDYRTPWGAPQYLEHPQQPHLPQLPQPHEARIRPLQEARVVARDVLGGAEKDLFHMRNPFSGDAAEKAEREERRRRAGGGGGKHPAQHHGGLGGLGRELAAEGERLKEEVEFELERIPAPGLSPGVPAAFFPRKEEEPPRRPRHKEDDREVEFAPPLAAFPWPKLPDAPEEPRQPQQQQPAERPVTPIPDWLKPEYDWRAAEQGAIRPAAAVAANGGARGGVSAAKARSRSPEST